MATWSNRRKSLYALLAIAIIVVGIGLPGYRLFYVAPSCTDSKKNGDEKGVDCGGSCTKLCSSNFISVPPASWVRYKEVAPGLYNVAAYIINPNKNASAKRIPYKMIFIDRDGIQIGDIQGTFDLPPGRNTLIFKTSVSIQDQKPVRAIVDFDHDPDWVLATDALQGLDVADKEYTEQGDSELNVRLKNSSPVTMRNVTVYAILKDHGANVIDFSKTIVDEIASGGTATAPFTWPQSHDGRVLSIEVLTVQE